MTPDPPQQLGNFTIQTGAGTKAVPILTARPTFILGRNGTGKSALVHSFVMQVPKSVYIPGSRPSYFDSDSLQLTPANRRNMESNWLTWDRQPHSRYRPTQATQRNERAILDLQLAETQFKVDAANEIKLLGANATAIQRLQSDLSPFDRVNALMRQANLPTEILLQDGEMWARRQGAPYSIARMSDGERTALVIAAEIVAAQPSTIFLIDEPELHLHRSIVVPFLAALIRERPDCAFVVSTHELELPSQTPDALIVQVRGCTWAGDYVQWWDVDVFTLGRDFPEEIRVDLLGSRRKILFVEGTDTSLDQPFYALLFPNASVRTRETARDVRQAVKALRALESLHHAKAFGLVDNDTLSVEHIARLRAEGVFALPIASIESLYYSTECIRSVAEQQARTLDLDAQGLVDAVGAAGLKSLQQRKVLAHLASRVAELKLRDAVLSAIPARDELTSTPDIEFKVASPFAAELKKLEALQKSGDLGGIIARYPVRESPLLDAIAGALRFRERSDYEKAVLARLSTSEVLREAVIAKLEGLAPELG